jgi:hypothetical protein
MKIFPALACDYATGIACVHVEDIGRRVQSPMGKCIPTIKLRTLLGLAARCEKIFSFSGE